MIFVFGGAHQGMDEYAHEICAEGRTAILNDQMENIDFSADIITGLERFVLGCVRRGESAVEYFETHADKWKNSILSGMDFSCGVVPMDAEMRLWRDENGRLNNYLSGRAERVVRMFCGIPQVLK